MGLNIFIGILYLLNFFLIPCLANLFHQSHLPRFNNIEKTSYLCRPLDLVYHPLMIYHYANQIQFPSDYSDNVFDMMLEEAVVSYLLSHEHAFFHEFHQDQYNLDNPWAHKKKPKPKIVKEDIMMMNDNTLHHSRSQYSKYPKNQLHKRHRRFSIQIDKRPKKLDSDEKTDSDIHISNKSQEVLITRRNIEIKKENKEHPEVKVRHKKIILKSSDEKKLFMKVFNKNLPSEESYLHKIKETYEYAEYTIEEEPNTYNVDYSTYEYEKLKHEWYEQSEGDDKKDDEEDISYYFEIDDVADEDETTTSSQEDTYESYEIYNGETTDDTYENYQSQSYSFK